MRIQKEAHSLEEVVRAADHYAVLLTERAEWLLELGIPNFQTYLQRVEWYEDSPIDALESQTGSQVFRHQVNGAHHLDGYRLLIRAPLPRSIREKLLTDPTTLNQLMRSCRHHFGDQKLATPRNNRARCASRTNHRHPVATGQNRTTNTFSANALAQYQRLARS